MNSFYFTSDEQRRYAEACLIFAHKTGLIDDPSLDAVKSRCEKENENRRNALNNGEVVYGVSRFSPAVYLDYELTRFRLDFVAEKCRFDYSPIDKKQLKAYFKSNRDLFTRYNGEKFRFNESRLVVYKKIREEQYDNEINNILHKLP